MLLGSLSLSAQTIYVNSKATGTNDGTSWANAYTKLEPALAAAANSTEIWVAAGVYKPDPASSTTASYSMKKAAKLYGGFKGTETALSQRSGDKQTGAKMEDKAARVLASDRYAKATKELAASVLSQANKQR